MPTPANLVHQTATTTGTGNFTLNAVNGKQGFSTAFSTGGTNVFDYFISNQSAAEWERGTGHMSDATTLVRDTVIESTNSNAAVSFSAGTKDVTNDVPAAKQAVTDLSQTLTNKTLTSPVLNTGVSGTAVAAQSDMETATSTSLIVTPGRQQFHPSAVKGWARWDAASGSPTLTTAFNVTSVGDSGTGQFAVNWTTAFANAFYMAIGYVDILNTTNASGQWMQIDSLTAGAANVVTTPVSSSTPADRDYNCLIACGDQ